MGHRIPLSFQRHVVLKPKKGRTEILKRNLAQINLISYIFHCIGDPEVSQALEQPIQWLKDTIKDLSSFFFFDISKSSFRLVSVTVIQWGQQIQIYNTEKEKVLLTSFFF